MVAQGIGLQAASLRMRRALDGVVEFIALHARQVEPPEEAGERHEVEAGGAGDFSRHGPKSWRTAQGVSWRLSGVEVGLKTARHVVRAKRPRQRLVVPHGSGPELTEEVHRQPAGQLGLGSVKPLVNRRSTALPESHRL